jgi:hypothetical protein
MTMATKHWVKTQVILCERINKEVFLLEERIYPDDVVPDNSEPFQVRQRKCSHWLECNLVGHPCCWSGINPNYDPFSDASTHTPGEK